MSGFSNFAVSFTIISILSGCMTLYGYGMATGGPVVIVWGWPFVGIMTLMVGLAMAEVCSSFPTAGGLYYWAAKLARRGTGPAWSWFTGWFNFLGQVAITAGIDFGAAFFINALAEPGVRDAHLPLGHDPDLRDRAAGARPAEPVRHPAGRAAERHQRLVAHPRRAAHRRRAGLRARRTTSRPASCSPTSSTSPAGTAPSTCSLLGLLLAQYTFTGYDASAHMTEETHNAAPQRPARHRDVDRGVAVRRLDPADRDHVRHPALRRRGGLAHRRAAGPDLHRRRWARPPPSCCCWS